MKKLKSLRKSKGCTIIGKWIKSIVNHLYFVAAAGNGDGDLIVSMWRSMLNHICNQHVGHQRPFTACLHGPLEDREWMKRDSLAFSKMRAILECPRLLNDLRQLSPDDQTFSLEALNSLTKRYVNRLRVDVVNRCTASSHKGSQQLRTQQPHRCMTDDYDKPDKAALVAQLKSRFQ
ncbi:uncharacterized protein LOC119406518 [Rhipicephalus sanguineus]|uniref:uncharacterized protein LOC119406518 n=1 Tax=Rhipicephalus sanguineus TaxID=34632 RepID=UPI001895B282|nr:uncharacterized protein LOC119406518 [Rhipicephalus sanguineus]